MSFIAIGTTATRVGLGTFTSTLPSDIQDNDLIIAIPITFYSIQGGGPNSPTHTGPGSFTLDVQGAYDISFNGYGISSGFRKVAVRADDAGTTYTWEVVCLGSYFNFYSGLATFVWRGPDASVAMAIPASGGTHGAGPFNLNGFANAAPSRPMIYATLQATTTPTTIADSLAIDRVSLFNGVGFDYKTTHVTGDYPVTSVSGGGVFGTHLYGSPTSDYPLPVFDHWAVAG